MRHQLAELIKKQKAILDQLEAMYNSLDGVDYKDNYNYILEEGCKYMGIKRDDLKKGTGTDSAKRMMIVRAVRHFTDTPLRTLKREWNYADESYIYELEKEGEYKYTNDTKQDRVFRDNYDNMCKRLGLR